MNKKQLHALSLRDTDTAGALRRLSGDEAVYTACLEDFLSDETADRMNAAIEDGSWDEAFTAAHALKGAAGNMGFVPLMHSTGQLIVTIRGGRTRDIPQALDKVNSSYRDIMDGIRQFFALADEREKGETV